MTPQHEDQPQNRMKKILEAGAEIAGTTAGAGAGLVLAGPEGALAGAGLGAFLSAGLKEFAGRMLSRREEARVGAACSFAAIAIQERLGSGDELRSDGFFASDERDVQQLKRRLKASF